LWEILPLRTTAALGDFSSKLILAQRFGDLRRARFPLAKLDDSNWAAADHAMQITEAFVDDEKTLSFDAQVLGDDAGNTRTVVRLAAPAPPDAKVSASGIGRLDPVTGELIQNPADIMEFILRLAGRTETFPLLRAECAAEGIVLAGSLDRAQSIRAWLDEVAYSAGAIWTPEAARLYPVDYVRGSVVPLDRFAASIPTPPVSTLEDTADVVRLFYDPNDATSTPQQYVELSASPDRFGGLVTEVTLRWMRQALNAETIGRRMLGRMAGERYRVTFTTDQTSLRPGQWVQFIDHPQWMIPDVVDPLAMVLSVDVDLQTKKAQVTAEVIASTPTITVTAHSVALPSTTSATVSIAVKNGVLTATINDDSAKPVKNAQVSLDGGAARKTNESGQVSFIVKTATPPKKHELAVQAKGFTPFQLDVFF